MANESRAKVKAYSLIKVSFKKKEKKEKQHGFHNVDAKERPPHTRNFFSAGLVSKFRREIKWRAVYCSEETKQELDRIKPV